jgi:alkaline phosphatase
MHEKSIYKVVQAMMILIVAFSVFNSKNTEAKRPKNVVFIIADGFGFSHITAARIYKGGVQHKLNLEKFKYTGLAKTYCSNCLVTDSAAAASALSTGVKVPFKAVGVGENLKTPLKTIMDVAKSSGRSTGVITTDSVIGGTPAAFYAHVKKRSMKEEIVNQIQDSGLDILMGGGREYLRSSDWKDPSQKAPGKRKDKRDITSELSKKGWEISEDLNDFTKNIGTYIKSKKPFLGTFAYERLPYQIQPSPNAPRLSKMVEFAVEKLSKNKKGYVLMVEAANIDVGSHVNYTTATLGEVLEMDKVVGNLMKLKDTLVVLTSDHETSGLIINGYTTSKGMQGESFLKAEGLNKDPESDDKAQVISWMSGPGSNMKLGKKKYLGGGVDHLKKNIDYHPSFYIVNSGFHTGAEVPVLASGPGAENFVGFMENSDIPQKIAKAMGLEL